jgi:hypothetical protein
MVLRRTLVDVRSRQLADGHHGKWDVERAGIDGNEQQRPHELKAGEGVSGGQKMSASGGVGGHLKPPEFEQPGGTKGRKRRGWKDIGPG